jgi:DNA-binding transcriptional LysR family regulator
MATGTAPDDVSLQQFRALAAIAATGSFTLAAERLGLSQPAVSQLLKRMEAQLGQTLVLRGRHIGLTPAGHTMADHAQRALQLLDGSVQACRAHALLNEGQVAVAVGHLTAGALLPPLMARFRQAHPQLQVTLLDSSSAQLVARVQAREADLGIGSDIGQTRSELTTERLFSERMALFLHRGHPLAARAQLEGRHLDGLPFVHVNPDAQVWRGISRHLSAAANVYPQVVQHVAMLSTAFGLLQAGAGVALLPRYVASLMPPSLRCVPIVRPVLDFPVVAIRLAKQPLSPAAQAFLNLARKHLKPGTELPAG